jgi:hypothetical protein
MQNVPSAKINFRAHLSRMQYVTGGLARCDFYETSVRDFVFHWFDLFLEAKSALND